MEVKECVRCSLNSWRQDVKKRISVNVTLINNKLTRSEKKHGKTN